VANVQDVKGSIFAATQRDVPLPRPGLNPHRIAILVFVPIRETVVDHALCLYGTNATCWSNTLICNASHIFVVLVSGLSVVRLLLELNRASLPWCDVDVVVL
jgi:hypothetical protein